jgi:hypothetical protein
VVEQIYRGSTIAGLTEHGGRLFASGVNFWCADDPFAHITGIRGVFPNNVTIIEPPEDTNLWKVSNRTLKHIKYQTATTPYELSEDIYIDDITNLGVANENGADMTVTIDGEDFGLTSSATGYGVMFPFELEIGAQYRLTFDFESTAECRVYAPCFDTNGVWTQYLELVKDQTAGSHTKTFTVPDCGHLCLHFRVMTANVLGEFKNIVLEKVV